MKTKSSAHVGSHRPHHHSNNNYNNNNNMSSTASMKEAERRLGVILRTAKKMSCTSEEITGLEAVRKLTQGYRGRCRSWLKHILPIMGAVVAMLVVYLLVSSLDEQSFGCLQNTSASVVVSKDSVPVSPSMGASRRAASEEASSGGENDDQGTTPERWVASNGQSLRNER